MFLSTEICCLAPVCNRGFVNWFTDMSCRANGQKRLKRPDDSMKAGRWRRVERTHEPETSGRHQTCRSASWSARMTDQSSLLRNRGKRLLHSVARRTSSPAVSACTHWSMRTRDTMLTSLSLAAASQPKRHQRSDKGKGQRPKDKRKFDKGKKDGQGDKAGLTSQERNVKVRERGAVRLLCQEGAQERLRWQSGGHENSSGMIRTKSPSAGYTHMSRIR